MREPIKKNVRNHGARSLRCFFIVAVTLAVILSAPKFVGAETIDVHDGRLSIIGSYGFEPTFYQDDDASGLNPQFGYNSIFLHVGGERCGAVCLGLSAIGSLTINKEIMGSVGGGPLIGVRWGGPSWAGSYTFHFGAAYIWTYSPQPIFNIEDQRIDFGDRRGGHGLGLWLALGLELIERPRLFTPVIGLRGGYTAVLSNDPYEHHLHAQVFLGITLGRRLIFGEGEELEIEDGLSDEADDGDIIEEVDEEEQFELDPEEERRLREAEEELRR